MMLQLSTMRMTSNQAQTVSKSRNDDPVRIWIDIRTSNGLHLSQKNLSYQNLEFSIMQKLLII